MKNWKKELSLVACCSSIIYSFVLEYKQEYVTAIYWLLVAGFICYLRITDNDC